MEAVLKSESDRSLRAFAQRFLRLVRQHCAAVLMLFTFLAIAFSPCDAFAEIALPAERDVSPVTISAETASRWREGGYEVWRLQGNCRMHQGSTTVTCEEAVVWLDHARPTDEDHRDMAIIYAESGVEVTLQSASSNSPNGSDESDTKGKKQIIRDDQWLGRMTSIAGIKVHVGTLRGKHATDLPILDRANQYRKTDLIGQVQPVQWIDTNSPSHLNPSHISRVDDNWQPARIPGDNSGSDVGQDSAWQSLPPQGVVLPGNSDSEFGFDPADEFERYNLNPEQTAAPQNQFRQPLNNSFVPAGPDASANAIRETRVRFLPRGGRAPSLKSFPSPGGNEQIWIASGGVKVVVESDDLLRMNTRDPEADGRVVIEADEVVAWTNSLAELQANGQPVGPSDKRWELYLEGNIVFASGRRVIYADRMYYDTTLNRGTILNAELLTPVPEYDGLVRLKSDVLQQVDQNTFQAYGAAVTSSRLGVPRYWLQSNNILLTQSARNAYDPVTGQMLIDPNTGLPQSERDYSLTSRGNSVFIGQVPVLYWPTLKSDLNKNNYYLNNIQFKTDRVFGTQVLTQFDMFQLLGIRNTPNLTEWTLDADYLSDRGPALGTNYNYRGTNRSGRPGNYIGELDIWAINDTGLDNLGLDRQALVPAQDFRGRAKFRHRHNFGDGFRLTAEAGYVSDGDFLESFYEREWDTEKDQLTRLQLSRTFEDQSFNIEIAARLNQYFMQTESFPQLDHFLIGRNLFDRATWFSHSQVGYQRVRQADEPPDPVNFAKFTLLPGEANHEGLKAMTRQEIDFPMNLGPIKTVPYLLGEVSYWGEDLTGESLSRTYGQVGIRNSLPIWQANNSVSSELLNLNGLAHKVTFESDVFFAEANEDLTSLPRYYQLDDDAQEQFRRRFSFDTFGTPPIPTRFDDRLFAFRSNQQGNVTSPASEIADDLFAVNFGVGQRWQTKRGAPGNQRIVDWVTFDVEATFFPKPERDNFGAPVGLLNYDFKWHLGDRVSVLSDGYFDFFGQGLRTGSIGLLANRPGIGSVYTGFRTIEGPISSNVLLASYNYRMSEKWILSAGSSFDLGPAGNLGQRLAFTRIGESFLVQAGVTSDISRDNLGFVFGIEPRFYARNRSTILGGEPLPALGAQGLE